MTPYPFYSLEALQLVQLTFKGRVLHEGMTTGRQDLLRVLSEAAHHNVVRVHSSNGCYILCPIHGRGFTNIIVNIH